MALLNARQRRIRRTLRRGNALIEFALISLVLYLLLAGTVEFGRALFVAQGIQDVARLTAREMALTQRLPGATFDEALRQPPPATPGAQPLFEEQWLVVQLDPPLGATPIDPGTFLDDKPLLNRALRPFMIVERVTYQGVERTLLRYPGALLEAPGIVTPESADSNPGLTVGIPLVDYDPATGQETGLSWIPIVEDIGAASGSQFPLNATGGGLVQLRINYPFQAAALTFHGPLTGPDDVGNLDSPVLADDAGLTADAPPAGTQLATGLVSDGAYGGAYGLGRLRALGNEVRPFRRVLSGQAIFRREVFQ